MRRAAALLPVSMLAAATVTGSAVAAATTPTADADQDCRSQWADLVQLHNENGNPGGPVKALTRRWEATDEAARDRAATATAADCGSVIDQFAAAWDALESFQYDLHDFDPRRDLLRAERDRRHYIEFNDRRLPPALKKAFVAIRRHTQPAVRDLRPALADAPDVDVEDSDEVRSFLQDARAARANSSHIDKMRRPYRVIRDAELHEE